MKEYEERNRKHNLTYRRVGLNSSCSFEFQKFESELFPPGTVLTRLGELSQKRHREDHRHVPTRFHLGSEVDS